MQENAVNDFKRRALSIGHFPDLNREVIPLLLSSKNYDVGTCSHSVCCGLLSSFSNIRVKTRTTYF